MDDQATSSLLKELRAESCMFNDIHLTRLGFISDFVLNCVFDCDCQSKCVEI